MLPRTHAPVLALLAALLLGSGAPARGCTTVIVGKKASTDGSIYIGRTDDTMASWAAAALSCLLPARLAMQGIPGCSGTQCSHSCSHRPFLPVLSPLVQNAIITNNALWHPPRAGPALFRSNVNGFQFLLPGPGLSYTAVAKNYGWTTWPQASPPAFCF